MSTTIGIRFQDNVLRALDAFCSKSGQSRSETVNELVRAKLKLKFDKERTVQDRESGREANAFGRETARLVAAAYGVEAPVKPGSNRYRIGGREVVLKCARLNTSSVGVTYRMLDEIDAVWGVFETGAGRYEIIELTPNIFGKSMRATASRGASSGRVGLVSKSVFLERGRHLRTIRL